MEATRFAHMKSSSIKRIGLFIGLIAAVLVFIFADLGPENYNARLTASIAALMSVWWIFEAIPLAATALIPLVLFPILGIVNAKQTSQAYMNSTIFLFMGGFIIAIAMEKWNLHKRIALNLISLFGSNPSRIIMGFMVASAFISMWISNTATAVMLLPIGLAILYKLEDQFGAERIRNFSISLLLGIAYACSIGGIATFIGTPPNLVFRKIYAITFPARPEISFGQWMSFGVPIMLILLVAAWAILVKLVYRIDKNLSIDPRVIKQEKDKLGKITYEEKNVLIVFVITAFLWIFRTKLDLGFLQIPGWSGLFSKPEFIDDGTVAITMSLILFLLPVKNKKDDEIAILDFSTIRKVPWDIILLFGGGFALADGFVSTGLSDIIGRQFTVLNNFPIFILIIGVSITITFLTELTSNTATAQIILPILAALSIELKIDPLILMIPATMSASMAFMMPVATPPNAIVFSSQRLRVFDMAKAGLLLNLIGAVVITLFVYFIFV